MAFRSPRGHFLFLRRGAGCDHPGEWCFPGGGIEPGETPEDAAARECREEIGRDAGRGIFSRSIDNGGYRTHICSSPAEFEPVLNREHDDWSWSTLDNPPEPLHPGVRAILPQLEWIPKYEERRRADQPPRTTFSAIPLPSADDEPACADFSLPGPSGKKVAELLRGAVIRGRQVLAEAVETATRRMLAKGKIGLLTANAELFDRGETQDLVDTLGAAIAAADLLGRARVLRYAGLVERWGREAYSMGPLETFSDLPRFGTIGEALRYFGGLVPKLGIDPERYGKLMERHAFTMAVASEQTLLDRVKASILKYLGTNWWDGHPPGSPTGEAVVSRVLDAAGVTPVNPQYCFVPDTIVEGSVLAASKAWYDGPVVEIETNDGRRLTVTVNHPILTTAGWKRAGDLNECDHLLCYGSRVEPFGTPRLIGDGAKSPQISTSDDCGPIISLSPVSFPSERWAVNHKHGPTRIEDVFNSIASESGARFHAQSPVGPLDFYGDASFFKGQIDCVWTDGELVRQNETTRGECGDQVLLVQGNIGTSSSPDVARGLFNPTRDATDDSSPVSHELFENSVLGRLVGGGPPAVHAFGVFSDLDATVFKASDKSAGGDVQLAGDLIDRLPGVVSVNRVLNVKRISYSGHVYDLQTTTGMILSQGIVSSNCEMVFRTNVLDAFHTGMDRQLASPTMQDRFPVWQYLIIDDERTGDDHRPKGNRYYPSSASFAEVRGPRPWNCRCSKYPLTAEQWDDLQAQGAELETDW